MEAKVINLLKELRAYALEKGQKAVIQYHEEVSSLMRFANSAISLNTDEHLVRLDMEVFEGKKRASYSMIADPRNVEPMKRGLDIAAEMLVHAQPLSYQPSFPDYKQTVVDKRAYDPALAQLSNSERLAFFNTAAAGLETDEIKLSGIFSSGVTVTAQISTASENSQYFASTDANITVVISNQTLKWEINVEQSAQAKADLDPEALHEELVFMLNHYSQDEPVQVPLGDYKVVFGAEAIGDVLDMLRWFGPNGGMMRRGYSFLKEEDLGSLVFSPKFSLTDDPSQVQTFPFSFDLTGKERKAYPIFEDGVFKQSFWFQDDADEFGEGATGHTVYHNSMTVTTGDKPITTLAELVAMPRDEDILFIPYIHYMNVVNPTSGMFTGSSRFGALLLKKDGTVQVPYNVRVTQTFKDLFGERLEWLSQKLVAHNVSSTYGRRNPSALMVPRFMCVNGIKISHSNSSY